MVEPVPSFADLYDVVPEQFVASRDALVRQLRSAGEKAEAARVAKLRRPPLTAWALNQVARMAPEVIEKLHQAGNELRTAMEQALGGDASGLRQAQTEERREVDAVVAEAERRLQQGGYSPTDVLHQRMAATLRAAIVDDAVATRLRDGRLEGDHEAPGFGMDSASLSLAPSGRPASKVTPSADATVDSRRDELIEQRRQALEEAKRLVNEATALEAEAERWGDEARHLAAQSKAATERSDDARTRAQASRKEAATVRAEADRTTQDLGC